MVEHVFALPEKSRIRVGERHRRLAKYISVVDAIIYGLIELVERLVFDRLVPGSKLGGRCLSGIEKPDRGPAFGIVQKLSLWVVEVRKIAVVHPGVESNYRKFGK